MMKIKFLLFVFVLFPVDVWGQEFAGPASCFQITDDTRRQNCVDYYKNKDLTEQKRWEFEQKKWQFEQQNSGEPQPDCFLGLLGNLAKNRDRALEFQEKKSKDLVDAAKNLAERRKNCRRELRETWIALQEKKAESAKERNLLSINVRQANIKYERELNRISKQCRQKSNKDFQEYYKSIAGVGTVSVNQLHGFRNKVNGHRRHFFQACYRAEDNVNAMKIAQKQRDLLIDKCYAEMKSVSDMVQSLEEQTGVIQDDILKDCEAQKELEAFHFAQVERVTSMGYARNNLHTKVEFGKTMAGCMGSGGRGISIVDPTWGSGGSAK